jgi:hypothetical protein
MSKPLTISSLQKEKGEKGKPATAKYPGISTNNRFLLLAEKGKAARDRSLSAKRFRTDSECTDVGDGAGGEDPFPEDSVFASMEKTEAQLKEAKTIVDQVKLDVEKITDPDPVKAVLDGLVKWMALTTSIQENTASVMLDEFAKTNSEKASANSQVRSEGSSQAGGERKSGKGKQGGPDSEPDQDPRKKKLFRWLGKRRRRLWSSTWTWARWQS